MSITNLQNNIVDAKEKIENYKSIISSVSDIKNKLDLCSTTLSKTGDLIGKAIVLDGKPGDNGNTAQIAAKVSSCSGEFSAVSGLANAEITKLNQKISDWQNEISRLKREEQERLAKAREEKPKL